MSRRVKLLIPDRDYNTPHLRDTDKGIKQFGGAKDGWAKLPTLCGIYIISRQYVTRRIDPEKLCDNCRRIAENEGMNLEAVFSR